MGIVYDVVVLIVALWGLWWLYRVFANRHE